jgi:uncharacterized protein with WD repeat
MGSNTSHCAVGFGWSPCGRHFMTATLAPRMNVDNVIKASWRVVKLGRLVASHGLELLRSSELCEGRS